jgi:hypothetical protein
MAQTFEAELVRVAREVTRLQARMRKLRRDLKKTQADLKVKKRELTALASKGDRQPDVMPSRLFGDAVGHKRPEQPPVVATVNDTPLGIGEGEPDPEAVANYHRTTGGR